MKTCFNKDAFFDEGTLQAYLDGELSPERAGEVAAHIAACEGCAAAARAATQEFASFSMAFGTDETVSVPTERLRARLDARLAELQPTHAASHVVPASPVATASRVASASLVERLRARAASLAAQLVFVPRQTTALASFLVAAVLLATIFFILRPQTRVPQDGQHRGMAKVNPPTSVGVESSASESKELASLDGRGSEASATRAVNPVRVERVKFVATRETRLGDSRGVGARANDEKTADPALLPIEKSYVSAIASLKSSIDQQGARMMTPTLRAEYERNLAVVDQAIVASRVAARRDPADKDAREFLRAAYQDKLDLLHAVSDQTEIATIAR